MFYLCSRWCNLRCFLPLVRFTTRLICSWKISSITRRLLDKTWIWSPLRQKTESITHLFITFLISYNSSFSQLHLDGQHIKKRRRELFVFLKRLLRKKKKGWDNEPLNKKLGGNDAAHSVQHWNYANKEILNVARLVSLQTSWRAFRFTVWDLCRADGCHGCTQTHKNLLILNQQTGCKYSTEADSEGLKLTTANIRDNVISDTSIRKVKHQNRSLRVHKTMRRYTKFRCRNQ